VPQDPATQAEEDAQRRAREAQADAAFEAANAGFVESFKADAARRAAVEADKVVRATRAKERGNAAFKRGDSRAAIAAYHEALHLTPFNVALLNNLALVHLQAARGAQEDAAAAAVTHQQEQLREPSALDCTVEFCARAIRVEPYNVKALFRRATALLLRGKLAGAGAFA
jgi:tetratricopeptide (TPR) repeat protein